MDVLPVVPALARTFSPEMKPNRRMNDSSPTCQPRPIEGKNDHLCSGANRLEPSQRPVRVRR